MSLEITQPGDVRITRTGQIIISRFKFRGPQGPGWEQDATELVRKWVASCFDEAIARRKIVSSKLTDHIILPDGRKVFYGKN